MKLIETYFFRSQHANTSSHRNLGEEDPRIEENLSDDQERDERQRAEKEEVETTRS